MKTVIHLETELPNKPEDVQKGAHPVGLSMHTQGSQVGLTLMLALALKQSPELVDLFGHALGMALELPPMQIAKHEHFSKKIDPEHPTND